jgi:hypothetical protein
VPYLPEFTGPIEGFVVNYISKNYWRVARTVPREDLMQEAYVVFLRCKRKYTQLEEARHFMALFKTAWVRHFTDLANADTQDRLVSSTEMVDADGDAHTREMVGELCTDGELATKLRQAPAEVLMVLNLFLNAPQEILELAIGGWSGQDRRCKAGGSKRINQLLGLPLDTDVMATVEAYFSPD